MIGSGSAANQQPYTWQDTLEGDNEEDKADISTLRYTIWHPMSLQKLRISESEQSRKVRFHRWPRAQWKKSESLELARTDRLRDVTRDPRGDHPDRSHRRLNDQ